MLSATFTAFKFMPAVQMVTAGKESSETGLTWWERINGNLRFFRELAGLKQTEKNESLI